MTLLALLVWYLNPRQPDYKPAPLDPPSTECSKPQRDFVPSNITGISDPVLDALPEKEKNRAIYRLNMEPCSCGCQLSVARCCQTNSVCEASQRMLKKIAGEAKNNSGQPSGK
jgi:hypothetical protein